MQEWAIPEKIQKGKAEDMEFEKKLKNRIWKFQRSIKKDVEFPGVTKKIVEFPWGLGHWCLALEIPMPMAGCNAILWNFQG